MDNSKSSKQYAASFRDLNVYMEAMKLAQAVFRLSQKFPNEEKYSLTSQIRRSSRSISANIAEAWGKREYEPHFVSKLSDSLSECYETQCWLDHAFDCFYIDQEQRKKHDDLANQVAGLIRNTAAAANKFCGKLPRS